MIRALRADGSSILSQIGSLVLVSISLVLAAGIVASSFIRPPAAATWSLPEIRAALLDEEVSQELGLERSISQTAPFGTTDGSSGMLATAMAGLLHVPVERVRVRQPGASAFVPTLQVDVPQPRGASSLPISVAVPSSAQVSRALADPRLRLPGSEIAWQSGAGTWVTVRPSSSWLTTWRLRLLAVLLGSALLLMPLAWLAARRVTKPIRELAEVAGRINLDEPFIEPRQTGPREVRAAARALTDLGNRVRQQAEERAQALAAVAHDLRTPLTGLRLRAESAREPERGRMITDIDRMARMISEVIEYLRAGHRDERLERVNLGPLVRECAAPFIAAGHPVTLPALPDLYVQGHAGALQRAVTNLLENAVRHAGSAKVGISGGEHHAVVEIRDQGPGIPELLLRRVREPFFRIEESRNPSTGGTGLGLAIADKVAIQHGGALELVNRRGGGLSAILRISRGTANGAAA